MVSVSYGTAFHMLKYKAKMHLRNPVLMSDASGGMATAYLQIAKLAGAHFIIALTGIPHKGSTLLSNGADIAS